MNILDLIIIILFIYGFIKGWMEGFIKQVIMLGGIIIAFFCSQYLAIPFEKLFIAISDAPHPFYKPLSYFTAFLCIMLCCSILSRILQKFINWICLGGINSILGILFYELKIILILSALINIYEIIHTDSPILSQKTRNNSYFYYRIERVIPKLVPVIAKEFDFEIIKKESKETKESDNLFVYYAN